VVKILNLTLEWRNIIITHGQLKENLYVCVCVHVLLVFIVIFSYFLVPDLRGDDHQSKIFTKFLVPFPPVSHEKRWNQLQVEKHVFVKCVCVLLFFFGVIFSYIVTTRFNGGEQNLQQWSQTDWWNPCTFTCLKWYLVSPDFKGEYCKYSNFNKKYHL